MPTKIKHIGFNAYQNCFVVSLDTGCRIFNCHPLSELRNLKSSTVGSVKLCAILNRTNLIALVAGGPYSKFADNTVMIWDDSDKKFVLEVTVGGPIINVLLSYTRLVVVESTKIHVFNFPKNCIRVCSEECKLNPFGLAALSTDSVNEFLVFPGRKAGGIQIVNLQDLSATSSRAPATINAHKTEVVRLVLNNQGTLIATGSSKGTVVRVFTTAKLQLTYEFRRGADPANLTCLRFSPCSSFLAVSSNKGTVHIFAVGDENEGEWINRKTLFQRVGLINEETHRNCAQFSLPDSVQVAEVGFVTSAEPTGSHNSRTGTLKTKQSVVAVCTDGTYHRFAFTSEGSCTREGFDYFLDLGDEQDFWNVDF